MTQLKTRHFTALINRSSVNEESRTVEISVSSETPVERWGTFEVLDHSPQAVDLSRFRDGAAFLLDHDPTKQIGVIENPVLGADRVLRCTVRFSRSTQAQEAFQDILDGIKTKISVGYNYDPAEIDSTRTPEGMQIYTIKKWQPMEASLVAIPADASVGVGRSRRDEDQNDGPLGDPEPETDPENPDEDPDPEASPEQQGAKNSAASTTTTAHRAATKEGTMPELTPTGGQSAATVEDLRTAATTSTHRATEILELCDAFGLQARAKEYIGSERTVAQVKDEILADAQKRLKSINAGGIELTEKEARNYSYARAIFSLVAAHEGRDTGCFEREISDEIAKRMPGKFESRGGLMVPFGKRAGLDSGTVNKGKELIFEQYGGELIELLRAKSIVSQLGARVYTGLTAPIRFPRQTAAATAVWVAENPGANVADSNVTFDSVTLSPKTLQASTSFSRQLEVLGVAGAEAVVMNDLALVHALAWDEAALHGTGAPQPTGIYGTAGVNATAMGTAIPTFAKLQAMITAVAQAHALNGKLGWATTPGMAGVLATTLVAAAAGSKMIWEGSYDKGLMNGYDAIASSQISAIMNGLAPTGGAEQGIIFGNWADLLIGQFGGGFELIVDPYALKKQGMIEVTSFHMVDIAARHAKSFSVSTAATLS